MPAPAQTVMRGYEGQLYYTPPAGTEVLYINVTDVDLDVKADQIDFSDHSTQGWKNLQGGLKTWTATAKCMAIQSGTNQSDFYNALVGGTELAVSIRPQDVTGGTAYTGTCSVIGYKYSAANTGAQTIELSLSGIGALAYGTVATAGS